LKYSKAQDAEILGTISLISSKSIKEVDKKGKKKNYFEIQQASKVYCFQAETPEEKDAWLKALKEERDIVQQAKVTANDFDLMNVVGKGSFGKVMQVKKKDTGQIFAMKVLDKKHILDHNEVEHTIAEKNILQRLRHPFLVNLNWSFQTEDKLYFILDFVNGGELFFHLQREKKISRISRQILCGRNFVGFGTSPRKRNYLSRFKTRKSFAHKRWTHLFDRFWIVQRRNRKRIRSHSHILWNTRIFGSRSSERKGIWKSS